MKIVRCIIDIIVKVTDVLLIFIIGGIVSIIFFELIYRNIFNRSFRSAIEISGILFMWMIFIGIIHIYNHNKMIRFEILLSRASGAIADIFWYISKVVALSLGIVMIIAFYQMYPFISTRFYSTMRFLPFTMHYLPMAIAGGFMILKSVEELITKTHRLLTGNTEG